MSIHRRARITSACVAAVACTLTAGGLAGSAGASPLFSLRTLNRAATQLRAVPAHPRPISAQFRTVDFPGIPVGSTACICDVNNQGTLLGAYTTPTGTTLTVIEQGQRLTVVNFPGTYGVTAPSALNNYDDAIGGYTDANGVMHGWLRSARGTFTQIDDPAAGTAPGEGTVAGGINDPGEIVGWYYDSSGTSHGFIDDHGTFTTLDFPGASQGPGLGTTLTELNDSGAIVGYSTNSAGALRAFEYDRGTFTTIDAPGAGSAAGLGTVPAGITSDGMIAGFINNGYGGWVLYKGEFSSLNDPNAADDASGVASEVLGLSANGRLACGEYEDASGVDHGFVATLSR
jgi:probable HAF family extracellular repeat protein